MLFIVAQVARKEIAKFGTTQKNSIKKCMGYYFRAA